METKDYLISGVLIMVIVFAGLGFLVNFSNSQNGQVSIVDEPSIKALNSSLYTNLQNMSDESKSQKANLYKEKPLLGLADFILETVISAPKVFFNVFIEGFTMIFTLLSTTLGIPAQIIGGFTTIILIIVIFSIWRTLKQG